VQLNKTPPAAAIALRCRNFRRLTGRGCSAGRSREAGVYVEVGILDKFYQAQAANPVPSCRMNR
jgi:hypothetical protein